MDLCASNVSACSDARRASGQQIKPCFNASFDARQAAQSLTPQGPRPSGADLAIYIQHLEGCCNCSCRPLRVVKFGETELWVRRLLGKPGRQAAILEPTCLNGSTSVDVILLLYALSSCCDAQEMAGYIQDSGMPLLFPGVDVIIIAVDRPNLLANLFQHSPPRSARRRRCLGASTFATVPPSPLLSQPGVCIRFGTVAFGAVAVLTLRLPLLQLPPHTYPRKANSSGFIIPGPAGPAAARKTLLGS